MTLETLQDPDFREWAAEQAYLRQRVELQALDREHDLDEDVEHYTVAWESLSDSTRHPFRVAVGHAFDVVLALEAA